MCNAIMVGLRCAQTPALHVCKLSHCVVDVEGVSEIILARKLRELGHEHGTVAQAVGSGSIEMFQNPQELKERQNSDARNCRTSPFHLPALATWLKRLRCQRKIRTSRLLFCSVVLVAIDGAGVAVLLAIDLRPFLRRQLTTIGCAVTGDFMIHARFVPLQPRGLPGGELPALYSLCNAVLLIFLSFADLALWICVLHGSIVLVSINLPRKSVLLLIERSAVGSRQSALV